MENRIIIMCAVGALIASGCAFRKEVLRVQCVGQKAAHVKGPVVLEGDVFIYFDENGNIVRRESSTCGVQ